MPHLAPSSLTLFHLLRPLGRGAMGEVWLAEHKEQRARVAIKLLHLSQAHEVGAAEALFTEVRASTTLAHPNIVSVLDHGRVDRSTSAASGNRFQDGSPFLVMEFIPGHPLQTQVGRLPWGEAKSVLLQLLDALAHSHARGIIHRDLKPGNVLLRQPSLDDVGVAELTPKVTDFGVAQALHRGSGETREIVGTPSYMAPEQLTARWRDQGPWTDLYSLGCLAWSLVTGQPPFGRGRSFVENRNAHLNTPPPRLQATMPVPSGLEAWLRKLLAKRPQDRFVRAADAAMQFARLPDEATGTRPMRGQPETTRRGFQAIGVDDEGTVTSVAPAPDHEYIADAPDAPRTARTRTAPPMPESWRSPRPPSLPPQLLGVGLNLYELREPPLVGRIAEREALWRALRQVDAEGRARAVLLQGPSGTGTSRLAKWLAHRAHEVGAATVVDVRHSEDEGGDTGVLAALARHLRTTGLEPEERVRRLAWMLPQLGMHNDDDVLAVSKLLATSEESGAVQWEINTGEVDERMALARRLLEAIARGPEGPRPVLLLLDDIHWGSDALALARTMLDARVDEAAPVLIVMTAQLDALSDAGPDRDAYDAVTRHTATEVLPLHPLPAEEHEELVHLLLGMEGGLAERVARRTAGNPYFAVQLVGDWVRRGILRVGDQGFELVPGARVDMPEDLRQAWRDRVEELLQDLSVEELHALELAAVFGNHVNPTEWAAACRLTRADASPRLVELVLKWRLARRVEGEEGWRFSHPMYREVLQVRARESRRLPRLHLACARALQEGGGRRLGVSERLGRHLLMAGEPLPATAAMLRAAEERLAQRQLAQVERILDARAETLRRLDTPEEDPLWGEEPVVRCRMLRMRGKTQQAEEIGEEALRLARQYGWNQVLVKALAELSELARARGDLREAWRATTEAEPVARTINDPDLLARVRRKRGRLALLRGDLELAEELLLKAREVFMRNGDRVRAASCLRALGGVAAQQGLLEEAARRATQSLDASEGAGDRPGAAAAQCLLADIARRSDELEQARDDYSDAESRFARAGMVNVLSVTVGRALLRRAVAGARRAEPALRSALADAEHIGQRPTQGVLHVMLLEAAAGRGDRGAWEDHMAAARVLLVESGRIDQDMAEIAEAAGHAARKNGWEDAARSAFGLAMVQYTKLLRADDVVRCKAAMRG